MKGPELERAAHHFIPERLTIARELQGLTKKDLAERVGKTPSAISQFEAGLRPDASTVGQLALTLGVPPAFFAEEDGPRRIALDACHFRSLRSARQRDRRQVLGQGALLCRLVDVIEERYELPREQVSTVEQPVRSMEDIEQAATQVRRAWGLGLGPIPNVVGLLESRGVLVFLIDQDCAQVDAFSVWHGQRPCVFLGTGKGSTSRTRLDAAHELGHLVMHDDVSPGSPELERQANRFGAAFLLPRESFARECPRRLSIPKFLALKKRWGVSQAALFVRARELGLLSEASYRRGFMYLNKTGQRRQERGEPTPELPSIIRRSLELLGEDGVRIGDVAQELRVSARTLRTVIEGTVR